MDIEISLLGFNRFRYFELYHIFFMRVLSLKQF